jgi:outer membrane protein insertion porin family
LKIRPANQSTGHSITQNVLNNFLLNSAPTSVQQFPAFLGGDTQALLNFEYRIPIIGPLQFVPFFDIGSAFNLVTLANQAETSEFIPNVGLGSVILNPRGQEAKAREIRKATTPETPAGALPPGFRFAVIRGEQMQSQVGLFSQASSGIFDNYRASLGGEFRIQVPVINVPFRLIFALNPNARADNPFFIEEKKAIRFSVGRTF